MEKRVKFGILNNTSKHVKLVQFMDTVGNVNHTVIIDRHRKYDYNQEKSPPLIK